MKDEIARYLENNNLLFSEWKERHKAQGYTSFIQDGIVEPEVWFGESHRILFILKEAYNGDGIPNVDSNLIEEFGRLLPNGYTGLNRLHQMKSRFLTTGLELLNIPMTHIENENVIF